LPDDAALLAERALFARLAMERTLTLVPPAALAGLPVGSTLVVPSQRQRAALGPQLAARGIVVIGAERLLGAQAAGR
jgi:hypothetical protein